MQKIYLFLFVIFVQLLLTGCDKSTNNNSKYLSNFSDEIQSLLIDFESCVNNAYSEKDLHNVANFLSKSRIKSVPNDWKQRFCDAQKNIKFEYYSATVSIDDIPLIIKQIDHTSDGDALIPHKLVVGGHKQPEFMISSVAEYEYLKFNSWSSNCVPFLFEVESKEKWARAIKNGVPEEAGYLVVALCRNEKFSFKYYKYAKSKWTGISYTEFPRERALENLWDWMGGGIKYSRHTPKIIQDGLKVSDDAFPRVRFTVRPEAHIFYTGLTARLWAHLESDIDFWEFDNHFSDQAAKEHAIMYSNKYSIK